MKKAVIEIEGKQVRVDISDRALTELSRRTAPIYAELELYFSCLIRKKMYFREQPGGQSTVPVAENLMLSFRPVMTEACGKDFDDAAPPVTDFPIANVKPYVPLWVSIDYQSGNWLGEFGYDETRAA